MALVQLNPNEIIEVMHILDSTIEVSRAKQLADNATLLRRTVKSLSRDLTYFGTGVTFDKLHPQAQQEAAGRAMNSSTFRHNVMLVAQASIKMAKACDLVQVDGDVITISGR